MTSPLFPERYRQALEKLAGKKAHKPEKPETKGEKDEPEGESHLGRNVGMAAAAASPWAGLIGKEPMRHAGGASHDWDTVRKSMQAGDVMLTGSTNNTLFKNIIGGVSGHPYGYHVGVVGPNNTIIDSTPEEGMSSAENWYGKKAPKHRIQILRPDLTPEERAVFLQKLQQGGEVGAAYNTKLREALTAAGHAPDMVEKMMLAGRGGTYDMKGGVIGGLKELFLPKLTSQSSVEQQKAEIGQARQQFLAGGVDAAATSGAKRLQRLGGVTGGLDHPVLGTNAVPKCVGSMCSSLPASAMPAGKPIVPGKSISDVMPSDYLRSPNMKQVARYDPKPATFAEHALEHVPTVARLGVGAALAGGVYGASKLYDHFKQKPEDAYVKGAAAARACFCDGGCAR